MNSRVQVKVCGLTNLPDARWAYQCDADLLGFIMVPASPRYRTPEQVARLTHMLRQEGCTAQLVGVFAGESVERVNAIAQDCDLDLVQVHGNLGSPRLGAAHPNGAYLGALERPVIRAVQVRESVPWEELAEEQAWAWLLDGHSPNKLGGTGNTWNWELARAADPQAHVIVAGGLNPNNVAAAIAAAQPWGVDVSSGVERVPGLKDHALVKRFLQAARQGETI